MAKTMDLSKPFYQTIKTSLKSVVKDPIVIEKLTNAAFLTNRIMTHTLQFMKLFFIHLYDNGKPLPTLDKPFVTSVMKVLLYLINIIILIIFKGPLRRIDAG